jgi:hypothetical protein
MNQDAIAKQNAQDMIQDLTNAANERIMIMASGFAEVCLKPLFRAVYRLGVENGQIVSAEVNGQYQQMNPTGWILRDNVIVDVALTPEDSQAKAQALLMMHSMLTQDPSVAPLYQLNNKYSVLTRAMDLMGLRSPAYISNPETPQVQQSIAAQSQQEKAMQDMQMQMQHMMLDMQKFGEETKRMRVMMDAQHKKESLEVDTTVKADQQALAEREFEHEQKMDFAELAIEATQQRPVSL